MKSVKKSNAGRPTLHGVRKVSLSVRVTPSVKKHLEAAATSASECVEAAVRKSKAFREWEREQ